MTHETQSLPPPNPETHAWWLDAPQPQAVESITDGTTKNLGGLGLGEVVVSPYETAVQDLKGQLDLLPPIEDRELALNPDIPSHKTSLEELKARAKGWKLHLNFDPTDTERVAEINKKLDSLQKTGCVTTFKIGKGGGVEADAPGKEATVYVGDRASSKLVAEFISQQFPELLPPEGDTLQDDIPLAANVMARFENTDDQRLNQYGFAGFPILKEDAQNILFASESDKPGLIDKARANSLAYLRNTYGAYFLPPNQEI